jgi:hypothetical protein
MISTGVHGIDGCKLQSVKYMAVMICIEREERMLEESDTQPKSKVYSMSLQPKNCMEKQLVEIIMGRIIMTVFPFWSGNAMIEQQCVHW